MLQILHSDHLSLEFQGTVVRVSLHWKQSSNPNPYANETRAVGWRGNGVKEANNGLQPEVLPHRCFLPEGGWGPGLPVCTEAGSSPQSFPHWEEPEGHRHRAPGCEGSDQCHSCVLCQPGGTCPSDVVPTLTHSIKEVSELVLFKAGSQKVIWGLQDMFFEPKGGQTGAYGKR